MDRVLGTDTSHWSGSINFETMHKAGALFWYTKASDSYIYQDHLYEDSKFMEFSEGAFRYGKLLNGCFHWLQASNDPKVAGAFYLERYNRFPFQLPPILDFEERSILDRGWANASVFSDFAWRAQVWLDYVSNKTGRLPWIYTAKWFLENFPKNKISWMSKYPLIVADYTWASNVVGKPLRMPYPWTEQVMWQFSADKNGRGHEFGVGASDIDLNWWNGDYISMLNFFGLNNAPETPEPDPIPEIPGEYMKGEFIVMGAEQNIRSEPIVSTATFLTKVMHGYKISNISDIKVYNSDNIWLKCPEGWVALVYAGKLYLQQV